LPDGTSVETAKVSPTFPRWAGEPPSRTYGRKPIIDLDGQPAFAELAILRIFEAAGWEGVWVDTFRNRYLRQFWPSPEPVQLPDDKKDLIAAIRASGGKTARPWDVFCWSQDSVIFAESKWHKRDSVRPSQCAFLAGGLKAGLPLSSFLLVEWSFAG
jgi:hypothetical protein